MDWRRIRPGPVEAGSRVVDTAEHVTQFTADHRRATHAVAAPQLAPRTFDSICDICLQDAPGRVMRRGNDVYYRRTCPDHGERDVLVSHNGDDYERFDRAYHALFPDGQPVTPPVQRFFFITNACNLGCTYCLNEANVHEYFGEYDLQRFEADLAEWHGDRISLIGGEPFSHRRWDEFAAAAHRHQKRVVIFTNGLALADEKKVERLVAVTGGDCEIHMTFEGFTPELYDHLPVGRAHERKVAALKNIVKHDVSVALHATLEPGQTKRPPHERARSIRALIDYAAEHPFVHAVAFQVAAAIGGAKDIDSSDLSSVDRSMDDIVAALPVPIERRHVYVGQKLLGLATAALQVPLCEQIQVVPLFRVGDRWLTLNDLFDCDALDRRLDAALKVPPTSRVGLVRLLTSLMVLSVRVRQLPALLRLGWQVLPVFLRGFELSKVPRSILPIASTTVCDRYNFDGSVARRCDKTVFTNVNGKVISELASEMSLRHLRERPPTVANP